MKFELMVLKNNKISGESNQIDSWNGISVKLEEEYLELKEAIAAEDRVHMAEEVFDLIQVCIRALALLVKERFDLEQLSKKHNKKLVKRGWTHSEIIRIFLDK